MKIKNKSNKAAGLGIISSIFTSICCITPVLAVLAGISGFTSIFSWMKPIQPYLIGFTVLILGFAWYQKLKRRKKEEIIYESETDKKRSFWHGKKFLASATIISGLLITFPYYSGIIFGVSDINTIIEERENNAFAVIKIDGMTCAGCERKINKALRNLPGVLEADSDYNAGTAKVKYDESLVGYDDFIIAVESIGYKVIDIKEGE